MKKMPNYVKDSTAVIDWSIKTQCLCVLCSRVCWLARVRSGNQRYTRVLSAYIATVDPQNKGHLGAATLSFIQRLSFVRRLKKLQP